MEGFKDLTGKQFGKWKVLDKAESNGNGARWVCQCECGNIKIITTSVLNSGMSKSCGCINHNYNDLTGKKFGYWTVLSRAKNNQHGGSIWLCKCECGKERAVSAQGLKNGTSKSCGCHKNDYNRIHGGKGTRIYEIWRQMIYRCEKKKHHAYPKYGGRGITVCVEWHNFVKFREWSFSNGYDNTNSIDRIDNNKGYSPDNCRWTDSVTQMNNRNICHKLKFNGEKLTISQWAKKLEIPRSTLFNRLKRGWDIKNALTEPIKNTGIRKAKL